MAVGHTDLPEIIYPIRGVQLAAVAAGVRYPDRLDLVVMRLDAFCRAAVVTTQNKFAAAPVQVVRQHASTELKSVERYLLINTGNANAATGEQGYMDCMQTCTALAELVCVPKTAIWPFSTGVIGERFNVQAILTALPKALNVLGDDQWAQAADAIRTTDTLPKVASEQVSIQGHDYRITGMSKGSGMIRPNMATMLGFIATDANISECLLKRMLGKLADQSFNRITVDADTSTNDCCVLVASGEHTPFIDSESHPHYEAIYAGLKSVFKRLAHLIVQDGEGATKFVTVRVEGGATTQESCATAYAVAESMLVKTALFASDPNWGRIMAAVGNAGIKDLDQRLVSLWIDEVAVVEQGVLAPSYTEDKGAAVFSKSNITLTIDLGRGEAVDEVYTCDLSYDYVKINADYRS